MTESRKRRLIKIKGTSSRLESLLLRYRDSGFESKQQANEYFGDLYYLVALAKKAA